MSEAYGQHSVDALRVARQTWRAFQRNPAPARDIHVGLAATVTVEPCVPFLGAALLDRGFHPAVSVAPFNQLFQVCASGAKAFDDLSDSRPLDAIVLLWRMEELLPDGAPGLDKHLDDLARAVSELGKKFSGSLIVTVPPCPDDPELGWQSLSHTHHAAARHRAVVNAWIEKVSAIQGVHLADLDVLQRAFGSVNIADPRKWALYRQPWREAFWHAIAQRVARVLVAQRRPPKKCVVLDCDNTLWGGVVGEDGLAGIALGEEFPGSAFRAFQKQLLVLQAQGVLLALNSKNDADAVWQVFDAHDAMLLRREHLVAHAINWSAKSSNLVTLANELNIGLDSMVFIDDSPYELEEVAAACPGVTCLRIPEDPADLPQLLPRHAELFDQLEVSEEDRQRTAMMQAQSAREDIRAALPPGDFLAQLALEVRMFPVAAQHIQRVAQLINKTNQFNLTTRRRTWEEVIALADDPTWRIFALDVSDRFGDYGLVGVAIAAHEETGWRLDTFLLSCRVLGRGVETAFLRAIADVLCETEDGQLRAEYLPTDRNGLVRDFLPLHGFVLKDGVWRATRDALPSCPAHVTLAQPETRGGIV